MSVLIGVAYLAVVSAYVGFRVVVYGKAKHEQKHSLR
ncbi:hypothetical protein SAMN00017405_0651 [Desulfonispora thiosulfatigenes DSM 11270]|uniref:Uncharacterized protein n=1 Tax=Desulfonispora thiosulfatigenes DSM 11270 TaxID=656914 RepID=A0A1W1V946_DESTI|nr:hypothetical protein SAMN00017405_0651 [Desulfonispora thiosulfatigenes DSM 11270]